MEINTLGNDHLVMRRFFLGFKRKHWYLPSLTDPSQNVPSLAQHQGHWELPKWSSMHMFNHVHIFSMLRTRFLLGFQPPKNLLDLKLILQSESHTAPQQTVSYFSASYHQTPLQREGVCYNFSLAPLLSPAKSEDADWKSSARCGYQGLCTIVKSWNLLTNVFYQGK